MRIAGLTYKILLLFSCWLLYAACTQKSKVKLPRMSPTWSYKDKLPLGLNAAYRLLNTQFESTPVKIKTTAFDKDYSLLSSYDSGAVYVLITNNLFLSENEAAHMLNFVSKGNTLFISAEYIDTTVTKNLLINNREYGLNLLLEQDLSTMFFRDDTFRIANPYTGIYEPYSFYYQPVDQMLSIPDSNKAGVFGLTRFDSANYVGIRYGSGNIWIHSNPILFSNYFLLTKNNHEYFERVFSYINNKPTAVYWDDYYRTRRNRGGGGFFSLQVFFKYPALTWALLLGMSLLLLYVTFVSKRKQRPVPIIKPTINSSVSFVQTVGLLYLQKKDNRNIAVKMITYFFEHIRHYYFLNTHVINEEFMKALSRKSGMAEEKVSELMNKISQVQQQDFVSDLELLDLHNRINEFYK